MKGRAFPIAVLLWALLFCAAAPAFSQDSPPGPEKSGVLAEDNWELWRRGFEAYEAGETAYIEKKYEQATEQFQKSLQLFQTIRKKSPNWNRSVIEYRIALSGRKYKNAARKLQEQAEAAKKKVREGEKERESGTSAAVTGTQDPSSAAEIRRLKEEAERGRRASEQIRSLLAEKESAEQKYHTLQIQYNDLKKRLDSGASDSDLKNALNAEKVRNDALAKALTELRGEVASMEKTLEEYRANQLRLEAAEKNARQIREAAEKNNQAALELADSFRNFQKESAEKVQSLETARASAEKSLAEKSRAYDELQEELRKLRAGMTLSDATRKIEEEAASLKNENESLKNRFDKLSGEYAAALKRLETEAAASARTKDFMKTLDDRNKALASELETNKKLLEKNTAKALADAKALAEARKQIADQEKELKAFAEKINRTPVDAAAEQAKSSETIRNLETQLKTALDARTSAEKRLAETEAASARAKKDGEAAAELLKKQLEELRASTGKALEEEKKTAASLTKELDAVKAKNVDLEKQIQEKSANTAKLEQSLKELSAQAAANLKSAQDAAAGLRKDLDARSAALEKSESALKEKSGRLEKLESDWKTLRDSAEKTEKAALNRLEAEKQSLARELEKARSQAGGISAAELERMTGELTELRETRTQLDSAVKKLTASRNSLTESNAALNTEVASLKKELQKMKDAASNNTALLALQAQTERLRESEASFRKLYEKTRAEAAAERERREALDKEIVTLRQDLDAAGKRAAKLDSDLKKWMSGSSEITEERILRKDEVITELLQEQEKDKEEIRLLKEQISGNNAQMARYRKKIEEVTAAANAAASEAGKLRAAWKLRTAGDSQGAEKLMKAAGESKKAAETAEKKTPLPPSSPAKIAIPQQEAEAPSAAGTPSPSAPKGDPAKYEAAMKSARDAEAQGDRIKALWHYWVAADAGADRYEPYLELARLQLLNGDRDDAEKSYETALKLGAKRSEAIEKELKK